MLLKQKIIRRQPAMLPHRNQTSPPSLWPSRELRKYHYPLRAVIAVSVATGYFSMVRNRSPPCFSQLPSRAGVSWRTIMRLGASPRAGTYLMKWIWSFQRAVLCSPRLRRKGFMSMSLHSSKEDFAPKIRYHGKNVWLFSESVLCD